MEQKRVSCGSVSDQSPLNHPWLVAQNLDNEEDPIFYTMHDPISSHYRCRISELLGRCIRAWFHGWAILTNHPHNIMWTIWNPVTSETIRLPPLTLRDKDFESITRCCLSSPPNDPTSILMLTRNETPTIVFCRLDRKRKMLRWKEMTYTKQLMSIIGVNGFLQSLTCCNGKVYAMVSGKHIVIQVDIAVKDKEVVITLLPFVNLPTPFYNISYFVKRTLKGYSKDLYYFKLGFSEVAKKTLGAVCLFKLNWTSMIWEEIEDLKDAIFFLDINDRTIFYRHAIASELGGYIHIVRDMGKLIYSYNVKDRTVSLSLLCCLVKVTHVSLWECRLQGDRVEIKCGTNFIAEDDKEDELIVRSIRDDVGNMTNEEDFKQSLLTIPFDILKMIMEFCVGVEYLNFRATCKHCQLAAPMIKWNRETSLVKLQQYSLISPWLVVLNKHQGIISFKDPMLGNEFFMKTPKELIGSLQIFSSKYGWLLLYKIKDPYGLFFFNPFTNHIRKVPETHALFDCACFSAPPTSPDCIVVGLSATLHTNVCIYFINRESSWRRLRLDFSGTTPQHSYFFFPTLIGQDIYVLNQLGALNFLKNIDRPFWDGVVAEAPKVRGCSSPQYFLVNCDGRFLLVVVDEFGKFVEVLKLNESTKEWEKIDSLGKHVIYICGTVCLCMEAKTPEMENKIFFPRLHSKSRNIIFYSLETCRYHTFNGRKILHSVEDFFGTEYHVNPHVWIEPSWGS